MDPYPFDLGSYALPVSTGNPAAQIWFDRGLNWTFGFNHTEAIACFKTALEHDPDLAMAHWGVAYAEGPNYNMPWHLYDDAGRARALAAAFDATGAAMALRDRCSDTERALIEALPARYPRREVAEDMEPWNHAFADAMRRVATAHPDDLDIQAVFIESLLNLTPWKMWDLASGQPAQGAATQEARDLLERLLDSHPGAMTHPGLLHLYVHLMEMSPTPEKALRAGDALRDLVPDAGHLVHMPTHIDVLCGQYRDVVHWNQRAVAADLTYFHREGAFNIYTGYRQHNYHFIIYGALFLGQMQPALDAIQGLWDTVPEDMLRVESPPMADYFESYMGFLPHILIRFGRWEQAIALEMPSDPALYCTLAAHTLYARTIGHAALGQVTAAEAAEADFLKAVEAVPHSRLLHNNTVRDLLDIAKQMARGEITYRKGDFDTAFDHLRQAVALEDALPYDEPWGWMQPSRHALGALLFEQGRLTEAEQVYREDLGLGGQLSRATVHPDNVWALRGLHDCLKARGEDTEIVLIRQKLDIALARADRAVAASCFCAQAAMRAAE